MGREMKDSGIEWIGTIPQTWSVRRVKNLANVYTGNSIKDDQKEFYEDPTDAIPYIATKDVDAILQTIDFENGMYVKNSDVSFKRAPAQSTLLCIEGGSAGKKVAFTEQDVCFVNKLCCFHSNDYSNKYIYYYLMSPAFTQLFNSHISGLIGGVSVKELSNFEIILPPYEEQEQIASFLDSECRHIDAVIDQTHASIEEYKKLKQAVITQSVTKGIRDGREMKSSEIEWVGTIPSDWKVQRIKTIFKLRDERNYLPLEEVNLISLYTDLGVVQHCDLEKTTGNKASNADGYKNVYENDIIVNIILCWMGAIGRSAYTGVTSPAYDIYTPSDEIECSFYHHYFRTKGFSGDCYKRGKGIMAMRWRTYSDQFRDIKVVVPPIEEQREILEYLDRKTAEIDQLIAKKELFLTEMERYKKSLIFEYVTGKKEVV